MDTPTKSGPDALSLEILKSSFKVSALATILASLPKDIPQNSPIESPQPSPTRTRKSHIPQETTDLSLQLHDLLTQVCQFTIQEFTFSMKKERVPIQKNILRKTSALAERLCMQLPIAETAAQKLSKKIIDDQSLLLFALCHISKPLLEFLENHFTDYAEELQITNSEVNLNMFQPKIVEIVKAYVAQSMNISTDSIYFQILEESPALLQNLAFELSDQVCQILDECRSYIENLIIKFREKVSYAPYHFQTLPPIFTNKYFILSMFLELSRKSYQTIQDLLDYTIFHYAEPDVVEKFMNFAIENHDSLVLRNRQLAPGTLQPKTKKTLSQILDQLKAIITNKNKAISVYKIQNRHDPNSQNSLGSEKSTEDDDESYSPTKFLASQMSQRSFSSETFSLIPKQPKAKQQTPSKLHLQGLYIEGEDGQTKYIVYYFKKEFHIVYAPLISKRWTFQKTFVIDQQDKEGFFKKDSNRKSGWGVYPMKYKQIKDMLESSWMLDQLSEMVTWQNLSVEERYQRVKSKKFEGEMDTMFGFFLANVSRTNKLQHFLQQFGENAVNNGCMPQVIAYMPIVKEFLNLGGFGQQALITSQEIFTPDRTFTPVSTLAISTSFVSGMVLGQVLIPIPVVGGLVGGLIGGYLGNKGIQNLAKSRNMKKATDLVKNLTAIQKPQSGMWECSKQTLDMLQINFKILGETMPKSLKDDLEKQTKWINLIVFAYLGLFYNQNQQPGVWVESLDLSQKYLSMEKVPILETLESLKSVIEIIVKNL